MNSSNYISLLPYQYEFLTAKEKFVWLCAGLGSGKSYALAHYCVVRMLTNPETLGLICASTYKQLKDSILKELFRQLDLLGLKYSYSNLTGHIDLHCNGARVIAFSLENYEVLRGIEVGWAAIDEACLAKEEAYKVVLGRLRCPRSKALECRIVSTPRGYDYLYDRYVESGQANHRLIHATAHMNPYLPEGYVESLAANYTAKEYRQEVLAEFVSSNEGVVYHGFERMEHATRPVARIQSLPIWVGMDFNVNPMTAVLSNVVHGSIKVFDEIYLKNSNTYAMADEILKRYPGKRINIVPDATGKARKTSAKKTDHQILRDAGFNVIVSKHNPPIEDRQNTVNGRLIEGRIEADPSCKYLTRDLERVTHEDNPKYLTHISDALGYLVWHIMPMKSPRKGSRIIQPS